MVAESDDGEIAIPARAVLEETSTKVKVCGITNLADAELAERAEDQILGGDAEA